MPFNTKLKFLALVYKLTDGNPGSLYQQTIALTGLETLSELEFNRYQSNFKLEPNSFNIL